MMMMKNIKNRSGFTMIELLATITILGILMAVAIGAVSWILDLNEKRYYSTLEKNVALAAESYYADYRASLPKAVGQSRKLLLKTLVEQKYLPDVLDYGKGDCTASSESYVVVTKYSKKDYLYNVYFDCPAYKTRQEDAIKDLSITINFDYDDTKVKEAKASIKINSTEDNKIASYEYIIYKDGQNVYNSENVSAGYVDNINRQVKLKDYVPGNIRIVVTAYDMYGNKKTKEKEVAIYNNGLPECGTESPVYNKWTNAKDAKRKVTIKCVDKDIECLRRQYSETFTSDMKTGYITITGTNNKEKKCPVGVYIDKTPPVCGTDDGSKVWTNKNRKITVQCSDATSGCTTEKGYSKTFSKTTQKGKIEIEDKAGNTKECEVDVYVDKTPPKCVVTKENNSWTNKDVEVEVQCTDGESGCKKSTYSEVITSTTKTKKITVSDNVGNTATCTADAYVDKTAPTCTSSGGSNNWSTKPVTITGTCSDSNSGCKGNVTKTYSNNGQWTNQSPGTVYDKAGNSKACPANQTIKIAEKPNKPTINNPTGGNWVNYNFALTVSTTTTADVIGSWQYSYNNKNWTTYANSAKKSTFTTTQFTKERNQPVYIRVCNIANVCSESASTNIRIDKTKPTLGYDLINDTTGAKYTPGTWSRNGVYRYLYPKDNASGIREVQTSDGNGWWHEPNLDKYWVNYEMNHTYKHRVVDNAGNYSDVVSLHYMLDWTVPTCAGDTGSTVWTNKNRAITQYCSDSLSGCVSNPTITFTNTATQGSITIKDKAGNSNSCIVNVYIDKIAPYTPAINWWQQIWVNGASIESGIYGDCIGNKCGGNNYSQQLKNEGRECFTERQCNISENSKVTTPRTCSYRKTTSCGEPWPVYSAGDEGGSGFNHFTTTGIGRLCKFTWNGEVHHVVWGWEYRAYDNAGNVSQPLYLWELMNDVYSDNLLNYFEVRNGAWELRPGKSCPTQWPLL